MISSYLELQKKRINHYIDQLLLKKPDTVCLSRLQESMEYSLSAGGKRIRPIILLAVIETLDQDDETRLDIGLNVAAAFELVHTYSLIHDDLPAMDNDDLRRGKPTNHRVYGDAMAILAGDALLTFAFEMVSTPSMNPGIEPATLLSVTRELAVAAGMAGMVGGQAIDIESVGLGLDANGLEDLHRKKTGAIISAAVRAGGIIAGASARQMEILGGYGSYLGLAFQIADDILDIEGNPELVGKCLGKDAAMGKNTYPGIYGLEGCKKIRDELFERAVAVLNRLEGDLELLEGLADFIINRKL